jgi:thiol-disulfide isomerase/thioredoxin
MDNETVNFDEYKGKPLLVEAFATTCSHCQDQHSDLVEVYNEKNDSINFLSLSTVTDSDNIDLILEFNETYPSPWDLGWDENKTFEDTYNIQRTPTMVLFDEDGTYASCIIGKRNSTVINAEIDSFLSDPAGYIAANSGDGRCADLDGGFPDLVIVILLGGIVIYFIYIEILKRRK